MKKEIFSKAVEAIDTKYINEALMYKKSTQKLLFFKKHSTKILIAAVFCICFMLGLNILYPFHKTTVLAYAYETNEKINSAGTILSTGEVNDNGSMTGTPLSFYIKGKDIKTIRYSVKNQWIDFIDWTQKREEFGIAKNFTVTYGSDESEYSYLVVNWEPNELWEALSGKNISIQNLPQNLIEDTIVLEILYTNGKTETKAMKIKLQDNGDFVASFVDYTITQQDDFVNRTDSEPIDRSILYQQGSDEKTENKTNASKSYKEALTSEELEEAKTAALDYYENTVWTVKEIIVTENANTQYSNDSIEAEYEVGDIIIFHITAIRNDKTEDRMISVARSNNNGWTVINEGF